MENLIIKIMKKELEAITHLVEFNQVTIDTMDLIDPDLLESQKLVGHFVDSFYRERIIGNDGDFVAAGWVDVCGECGGLFDLDGDLCEACIAKK